MKCWPPLFCCHQNLSFHWQRDWDVFSSFCWHSFALSPGTRLLWMLLPHSSRSFALTELGWGMRQCHARTSCTPTLLTKIQQFCMKKNTSHFVVCLWSVSWSGCCWQCCLVLLWISREMTCWLAHSALLESGTCIWTWAAFLHWVSLSSSRLLGHPWTFL